LLLLAVVPLLDRRYQQVARIIFWIGMRRSMTRQEIILIVTQGNLTHRTTHG